MTPQNIWEKLCYENDNYLFELYEKYGKTRIYIKRTDKVMLGYITPDLKDEKLYSVSGIKNNWLIVTGSQITYSEIENIVNKLAVPGNTVQIEKIKPSASKKKTLKPQATPPAKKSKQQTIKPKPTKKPSKTKASPVIKKSKNEQPSISEVEKFKSEIDKIDKQIIDQELHFLDRGKLLKKRKDIYVKLHMETDKEDSETNLYIKTCRTPAAPIKNAAKILSISKRTIQEDIQIIESLIPAAEEVIKTRGISKREALLLIRKISKEQIEIIESIKNGEVKSIKEAIRKLNKKAEKRVNVQIKKELYERAEEFAGNKKQQVSKLIETLLNDYFKKQKEDTSTKATGRDELQMIPLEKIIIPKTYSKLTLSENKLQAVIDFYKKHKRFDKPVTVFQEITLIDGYKRYIAAVTLGLTELPVKFASEKPEEKVRKNNKRPPVTKKKKAPVKLSLTAKNLKGMIKRIVPNQGYGFIEAEDGETYFFHHSGLKGMKIDDLEEWYRVTFDAAEGRQGLQAVNIKQDLTV